MKPVLALCAALLLTGCSTGQAVSIAAAASEKHCAAEGKKFVYASTDTTPSGIPMVNEVSVTGYCE